MNIKYQIEGLFKPLLLLLLLLFLPSLVAGKYIGKSYIYVTVLIGMFFLLYSNYQGIFFSKIEERLASFGVLAFLLALTGFFQQNENIELTRFGPSLENHVKALIPLTLLPVLYHLKIKSLNILTWALIISVMTAVVVTIVGLNSGLYRAGGQLHGSAIIFGDLAILFGFLSVVLALFLFERGKSALLLGIGILGIVASLLSGSKGGWIVLATVPFVIFPFISKDRRKLVFVGISVFYIALLILIFSTENVVQQRMLMAINEVERIFSEGDFSGGSVGMRIDLWIIAWQTFLQNPIWGGGVGEFYGAKLLSVQAGEIPTYLQGFKHAHNEYLTILSGMGLIGMSFYIVFFVWLWHSFWRAASSQVLELKSVGILGLVTLICYFDFSLSESFLSSHLGAGAFYFLMTFYVYYINYYSRDEK